MRALTYKDTYKATDALGHIPVPIYGDEGPDLGNGQQFGGDFVDRHHYVVHLHSIAWMRLTDDTNVRGRAHRCWHLGR